MTNGGNAKPRARSALLFGAIVLVLAVILATGVGAAAGTSVSVWPQDLTPEGFRKLILSWGMWAVVGSLLLMVVHSFIPFPAEFVAIANGMCFGALWGTVITWTGAMLGALAAFALSRRLGRPFAERMVRGKGWYSLDDWLARYGGEAVFLGRFIPVIAFNLINYAAGLTGISYWKFIWATGLGILPMTFLMVLMGAEMHQLSLTVWLLLGAGVLVLWLIARRLTAHRNDGQHPEV